MSSGTLKIAVNGGPEETCFELIDEPVVAAVITLAEGVEVELKQAPQKANDTMWLKELISAVRISVAKLT